MDGAKIALGAVGALAMAAVVKAARPAGRELPQGRRGGRNLPMIRREGFDELAELHRIHKGRFGRGELEDRSFARRHGITFLGSGLSRTVFRVPEGALKIEVGWAPFDDNETEAKIWSLAPGWLARYLVPVLDHADDYAWILMPEVKVGGRLTQEAEDTLIRCGIEDFLTKSNVSKDGRLVDYSFIFSDTALADCLSRNDAQRGVAAPDPAGG